MGAIQACPNLLSHQTLPIDNTTTKEVKTMLPAQTVVFACAACLLHSSCAMRTTAQLLYS